MDKRSEETDWQIDLGSIAKRSHHLLQTGLWADCKFIVGLGDNQKEFRAHRLILSMASPVFERMFQKCYHESENDVNIVDIQPDAFKAMLDYIYTDEINLQSVDQACELCYAANKYMMPILLKHCTAYIWKDVEASNACRGYEFAKLFDQHQLMEKCKKIIRYKTSEVISQPSFLDIQLSTLKVILMEDQLQLESEMELFRAVENWTAAEFERLDITGPDHQENRQAIYDQLLPHICFLGMSAAEFAEGPALSPMLNKDQSFAILMNITTRNCACPMPTGFSTNYRKVHLDECIFLKWALRNFSPTHNFSPTESSILFYCNKDIEINGVMVMGQLPYLTSTMLSMSPGQHNTTQKYQECLDVYIEDLTAHKYEDISFQASVEFRSMIDVLFAFPIKMAQGRNYKLGVILKQPGLYMGGDLDSTEILHKSVKFTLMKISEPMFIHGIIFTN